jgi:mannose-6-phosphate isomerase-like protein (cupin superfamily)
MEHNHDRPAAPTSYLDPGKLDWRIVDVRGAPMQEARVMNGEHGIYSAFYRLPKGTEIRTHRHLDWVQVMVVEGRMEVTDQDGIGIVEAGSCYVVSSGRQHFERALEDSLVLVTSPEP